MVSKTIVAQVTVGSNPTPSAIKRAGQRQHLVDAASGRSYSFGCRSVRVRRRGVPNDRARCARFGQTGEMTGGRETRYAKTADGVHVAFQTFGDGPLDLVCVGYGNMVSVDMRDEEPHFRRFERRLASFSRFVRFDPRGLGLSDPIPAGTPAGIEQGVDDLIAVLDAVGLVACGAPRGRRERVDRAPGRRGAPGSDRVARVDPLLCPVATRRRLSMGVPRSRSSTDSSTACSTSAETLTNRVTCCVLAPSLGADPEFRAWWKRAGQRSASPASARAMLTMMFGADVRAALSSVRAPTLVVHRVDSLFSVELSRYLVDHIPNARLVELPGRDHLPLPVTATRSSTRSRSS